VLRARWKLIIVFYLFRDGTLSLSELERAIPRITQKMLINSCVAWSGTVWSDKQILARSWPA
jgi:hypothetical protein